MVTTDRKHYEMLIGGERVNADEVFEIVSPATEELVATVARGSVEHPIGRSRRPGAPTRRASGGGSLPRNGRQ